MIDRLEIHGVHVDLDDDIKKYVNKKIGKLDKFLPRHARKSAHAKVFLSESKGKRRQPTCEVIIEVPGNTITAKESTINMFSSIDVVEAKLSAQLRKYKEMHGSHRTPKLVRKFLGKARRG